MIRLPLGSSRELLQQLQRGPRIAVPVDEAVRTLAADVVALQGENAELRDIATRLLGEVALLRNELNRSR